MHKVLCLMLWGGLVTGSLCAGTIDFAVTPLGGNSYQFNYNVSGFTFQSNEDLDIRFDPSFYSSLSNGIAPAGFNLILLQPNNPPGVFGDYDALAQVNNPSTAGAFSVQFLYTGPGLPGAQPYFLNQFNADGFFVSRIDAGFTQPDPGSNPVPEPANLALIGVVLCVGALWTILRRGRKNGSIEKP